MLAARAIDEVLALIAGGPPAERLALSTARFLLVDMQSLAGTVEINTRSGLTTRAELEAQSWLSYVTYVLAADMKVVTLGRKAPCDIVLAAPSVSSLHARLVHPDGGSHLVIDAGSTNGTAVDDEKIEAGDAHACRLSIGCRVQFGRASARYADGAWMMANIPRRA
jgi:hypothetical protein